MTAADHRKAMRKLLKSFTPRHRMWETFDAWTEATAYAIANRVTPPDSPEWKAREDRYAQIKDRFGESAEDAFGEALAHLVEALALEPSDQLGLLASELEVLSLDGHAQFFTPFDVSVLLARLSLDDAEVRKVITERGYITLSEPAAGAGGMVIAAAQVMRDMGLNPQTQMHATCWDVEATAAHMCYVQLALLHIPAVVVFGNTLTLETRGYFETPAHVWGLWRYRLARRDNEAPAPAPITLGPLSEQPALFQVGEAA